MKKLKRNILEGGAAETTVGALQQCLVDLIDLSLQCKQAHWNLLGKDFRAVHLQLDEIIDDVRDGADDVAERIVTINAPADGRSQVVAKASQLAQFPPAFQSVAETVSLVADRLMVVTSGLRKAIDVVHETDAMSEDLLVGLTRQLEKHLWMVQAQEV